MSCSCDEVSTIANVTTRCTNHHRPWLVESSRSRILELQIFSMLYFAWVCMIIATGEWRRLHKEDLYAVDSSPNYSRTLIGFDSSWTTLLQERGRLFRCYCVSSLTEGKLDNPLSFSFSPCCTNNKRFLFCRRYVY